MKPAMHTFFFDLVQKNLPKDDENGQNDQPLSNTEFIMTLSAALILVGFTAIVLKVF